MERLFDLSLYYYRCFWGVHFSLLRFMCGYGNFSNFRDPIGDKFIRYSGSQRYVVSPVFRLRCPCRPGICDFPLIRTGYTGILYLVGIQSKEEHFRSIHSYCIYYNRHLVLIAERNTKTFSGRGIQLLLLSLDRMPFTSYLLQGQTISINNGTASYTGNGISCCAVSPCRNT